MNVIKVIVIFALFCLIFLALALSVVGNHAVDVLADPKDGPRCVGSTNVALTQPLMQQRMG